MKTTLAIIASLTVCLASHAVSPISGPVVNPANQHTYYLLSDSTWLDAEAYSMTLGGHLVTINNAAEQNWVYSTFSTFGGGDRQLWIGLNDAAVEGNFVWASGEVSSFTHWAFGEPNNYEGAEDYASMYPPSQGLAGGLWNDSDNFYSFRPGPGSIPVYGVVEVIPEPAAPALLACGALALALVRKARK